MWYVFGLMSVEAAVEVQVLNRVRCDECRAWVEAGERALRHKGRRSGMESTWYVCSLCARGERKAPVGAP